MSDRVIIFDTTLRDGEQALAASLTVKEKLQIALALERLGVDVMEVGFPVSSPGDFQSVQTIAKTIKNSRVCALSRALEKDIDAAAQALSVADQFRIHTFISTSTIHVESKLKRSFDDVLEMAVSAVKYARRFTDDVEFSCEDAGRTPIDNLCRMVEEAIKAGARTINIPDTVGYTVPSEFGGIIQTLFNRVPNIDQAVISVHCHDDLGLSVANSITAVEHGARQIECTVNGIGERAGNCSLEEIAMILATRKNLLGLENNINAKEIHRTSSLVSQLCNMPIQANKAVVGTNAFSHSSGIHQDGMLKAKNTYEIMTPESIGLNRNNLNMTSRSGRHVIKHRMEEMGYKETDYDMDSLYDQFLKLADKKGQVFDYDLEALVFIEAQSQDDDKYSLQHLMVHSDSTEGVATATVRIVVDDKEITEAATGNGPVDAAYNAIARATGRSINITNYKLSAKGEGQNALGQVDITAEYNQQTFHGVGLATDVVESSAQALVHVMNLTYRADKVADFKQQIHKERELGGV
ncbi:MULTISPECIES: 2-isopropylmalate synthase [unclassified Shewanella]|uniref:2-isopropylmalate synthase n=1 Tax=unclassified Shewanella TaxID=196818 RepID=UPI000C857595|nr:MULTISPECIES: 2-isopropylmalate synthase [unclassified Shewanella]MDO6618513.1 2-isopropylmalate synthase [Shewanella sp. 6_MG-2023]MDO6640330.1 2-isopropylmalate synthase [Shewanella sp. 5_MG-2023]MDO6680055.1 2-isopropylmalate synthase [Shewanella sp. 4_MG-2023]MDO6774371.1 2-isopropylmalate synthase [Shewanella sp. 3_MG-2023]PMG28844.1 2-isopropylmalate synthase [Shewanella sp. 10N.286.52.C2]